MENDHFWNHFCFLRFCAPRQTKKSKDKLFFPKHIPLLAAAPCKKQVFMILYKKQIKAATQ
jgi:hypothetical protein